MDSTLKNNSNKGTASIVNAPAILSPDADTTTVRDSVVSFFTNQPTDPTAGQTLRLIEHSGAIDFWSDEAEEIYTLDDGTEV